MPPLRTVRVPVNARIKTPWWFKVLFVVGLLGSVSLFLLLIWVVVLITPAAVDWLQNN